MSDLFKSVLKKSGTLTEPLWMPNPKRFVLFPIQHQDMMDMYMLTKQHLSINLLARDVIIF